MAKRASPNEGRVDPVRSALSAAVSQPVQTTPAPEAPVPVQPEETPRPVAPRRTSRRPAATSATTNIYVKNKKVVVTVAEAESMDETLARMSAAFGAKITYSQLTRAMWMHLSDATQGFRASGRKAAPRQLPSTGDAGAMLEYEEEVASFLKAALSQAT